MVALLTSFIAKENTIATLGVLYQSGGSANNLAQALGAGSYAPAALAYLAVHMLFIPCVATVAAMHQELRSWRWILFKVSLLLVISFGIGIAIYRGFKLLNF